MRVPLSFGSSVQVFFTEHLKRNKGLSVETIASYRDTFRLLLRYLESSAHVAPHEVEVADLDAPRILSFLDYLECERHNAVRSRNIRLAAIRSFFRFLSIRDPESLAIATRVLAIPVKREARRLVGYLTKPEIKAILAAPNRACWSGRRDHALLLTLYNTGARVSEVAALTASQVRLGVNPFIHLHGKGRKDREVPLWRTTARVLNAWIDEVGPVAHDRTFPSARGSALTRDGVSYLLSHAVNAAKATCPSLTTKRVTPHVIRHTTAMHLLQSGVDISVIALWLGHASIETTHMYLEADLGMKERALAALAPSPVAARRFRGDDALLQFLARL